MSTTDTDCKRRVPFGVSPPTVRPERFELPAF